MATVIIPCLACRAGTPAGEDASSVSCATCAMALPPPGEAAWLMTRTGAGIRPLHAHPARRLYRRGPHSARDGIWHHGATVRLNANQLPALGLPRRHLPEPIAAPVSQPVVRRRRRPPRCLPMRLPSIAAPVAVAARQGRAGLHTRRSFNWDLRSLPVEPDEEERLLANGVDEADARRYLVWRRSVLLVVAIPTLVSALLATLGVRSRTIQAFPAPACCSRSSGLRHFSCCR